MINVFSKYAWCEPTKDKGAKAVAQCFKIILERATPRRPKKLQTDKGKEFFNTDFGKLMRDNGIEHFATESDQKAAVVERFNRTLKTRLWTFFSAKRTDRWVDELQNVVHAYNHSYHRSIHMAPVAVTPNDEDRIWARLYGSDVTVPINHTSLAPGEKVRLN